MVPDGYTKKDDIWGTTYDNHKVYVCWTGSWNDCLGYVNDEWIKVEKSGALSPDGASSNYFYYINDEGQMVYYYFW